MIINFLICKILKNANYILIFYIDKEAAFPELYKIDWRSEPNKSAILRKCFLSFNVCLLLHRLYSF